MSRDTARVRLGALIADHRARQRQMTQAELARRTGLAERTIRNAEHGEKISDTSIARIETVLELPPGTVADALADQSHVFDVPDEGQQWTVDDLKRQRQQLGDAAAFEWFDWLTRQ